MKSTIKLISGAAILLASLSGQAIAQETIKVGMSGKYFPFTFVKQDKLQGFEVDMWNQIGERTGYKVEFVTASFSGLFGPTRSPSPTSARPSTPSPSPTSMTAPR